MIKMETEEARGSYPEIQRTRERPGETEREKKLNARNREAIFYIGLGLKPGAHRRLIFLCGGATASRFTRQICDHKMADSKSNMVHRENIRHYYWDFYWIPEAIKQNA